MAEVTFYDSAEDICGHHRPDRRQEFFVNANAGRCQFIRPGKRSVD